MGRCRAYWGVSVLMCTRVQPIAFVSGRDGDREIYVMDADGSNVRQLTVNTDDDGQPVWAPGRLEN